MNNKDFNIFWLVIFVIILSPFVMIGSALPKEDKVSKKRRLSNILGIIFLGTILVGAVGSRIASHLFEKQKEDQAKLILDDVASNFADHNQESMMKWARGEFVDPWGNTIILSENTKENGVQFVSKGKDGKIGTEDDVKGLVATWIDTPVPESILKPQPENTKSMASRIKKGIGGLFGRE